MEIFSIVTTEGVLLHPGVEDRNCANHRQCTGQNPQPRMTLFIMSIGCETLTQAVLEHTALLAMPHGCNQP